MMCLFDLSEIAYWVISIVAIMVGLFGIQ